MSPLALLAFSFAMGMRHATDPDHVVAVSTLLSREGSLRAAAPIGLSWGVGHTLTVGLVGSVLLVGGLVVPPRVGLFAELAVAVMLVALGLVNLRAPAPAPRHGHGHAHAHATAKARWSLRSLLIGMVHGLAGSAAIALLALGAVPSVGWGMLYLAIFGAGTVVGMLLVTTAMALPLLVSATRFTSFHRGLVRVTGAASVAFGAFLVYDIVIGHGLFSGHPLWTPT